MNLTIRPKCYVYHFLNWIIQFRQQIEENRDRDYNLHILCKPIVQAANQLYLRIFFGLKSSAPLMNIFNGKNWKTNLTKPQFLNTFWMAYPLKSHAIETGFGIRNHVELMQILLKRVCSRLVAGLGI